MVSRDNKTPLPRKEFPLILTPLRDDKSGGDGESENDNWKNRFLGGFRTFMSEPFCSFGHNRIDWEEVHKIGRVPVKREELEQQFKIMQALRHETQALRHEMQALRHETSHTCHVNWEELIKKREAMERGTTECKVHVKHENERNRLEAELFIKAEGSIFPSYNKLFFLATGLVFCALGVYMAKGGVGVTTRFYPSLSSMKLVEVAARSVAARLGKPSLVRDTSRSGFLGALRCPLQEKMSEDQWRTSNPFFNRTGEPSRSLMLDLVVNLPEQFDWAIDDDQLDKMIEVDLPTLEERKRLVQLCFEKYVLKPATTGSRTSRIKIANFDFFKKCQQIAEVTEGLSEREISKIAIAWQNSAYGSPDGVLTEDMMDERVEEAVRQHKQKVE